MPDIQIFTGDFGQVRTITRGGEPWFVAADVCAALDVINPSDANKRLDDDERARLNLGLTGSETNIVSESGLYALVLGSRKPEAKAFKRWITHDVIPTIRKTGGYVANDDLFINTYLPNADDATAALFRSTLATMRSLNARIEADKPKVLFASAVETSNTSILVGELAKLIRQNGKEIGQNRLFDWLRKNGYIMRNKNIPTQYSMERGLMEVKERTITNPDGSVRITQTTLITGKGQTYFVNRFLGGAA
jgi:anti-repressor protein